MILRREFIAGLGSAAAWPLAAEAQQDARVRRVGVLTTAAEGDPILKANLAVLLEALAKLGWVEGRNLRIELRFTAGDFSRIRVAAAELEQIPMDFTRSLRA
jgi:putative tryptophan/tyrosine transport system substrate-binding protein